LGSADPVAIDRADPVVPEAWSAAAWAVLSTQPPFTTERFTVLFVDADGLKAVNDGRGYAAGNEFLRGLGVLLRHVVRPTDVLVRWGGDEFCVVATPPLTEAAAQALADRIMQNAALARRPCSVGWATQTVDQPLTDAITAASQAMQAVKRRRKAAAALTPRRKRARSPAREEAVALIHKAKASVSLLAVIGATVPLRRVGSLAMGRCPFHDDRSPSLAVYAEDRAPHWHCFGCPPGSNHGDVIDWVQRQRGGSRTEAASYLLATAWPAAPLPPAVSTDPWGWVDPDPRALAVYADLWPHLTLTPAHTAWLHRRGLTDAAIAAHGFKSLPRPRDGWPARLARPGEAQRDLAGIPGFSQYHGGWLHGAPGILLPVRDLTGRIVGAQIRPDRQDGAKYRWWSTPPTFRRDDGTPAYPGGASAAPQAHVATPGAGPLDPDQPWPEIWVTEGVLKATIAAEYLGLPVIGIPGIRMGSLALRPFLDGRPASIVVAFDQDPPGSTAAQAVAEATESLVRALAALFPDLAAAGRLGVAQWEPAHKGLDDALVADVWPTVIPARDRYDLAPEEA
jgi:DNA primase